MSLLLAVLLASVARGRALDFPAGGSPPIPVLTAGTIGDAPTIASAAVGEPSISPPSDQKSGTSSGDPVAGGQAPSVPPPPGQTSVPVTPTWPAHGVPPVGTWDIVATGGIAAALLTIQFAIPAPTVPKWTDTNAFDDGVRSAFRIGSEGGRQAAALTSDILVYALIAAPFLNATLVAGVEHERWDVAWRLMVLDTQTILLATTITISLQKATARERPYAHECRTNPSLSDCSLGGKYQSFPSGHTTAAFAAVALECFHHGYLDTSHTGWGSAVCPLTIVAAIGTAMLRIAADRHWATDIIVGASIGGLVGYAVPALHLLGEGKKDGPVVTPMVSGSTIGLTLAGRF